MQDVLNKMQNEMNRLKQYFPYRIVWGAVNPETLEYVTGATPTKRQANDYARKGHHVYTM